MRAKAKIEPDLITHREVAARVSVDSETLRGWVTTGDWPRPHAIIRQTWFYKKSMIDHWLKTAQWNSDADFKPGVGNGRAVN